MKLAWSSVIDFTGKDLEGSQNIPAEPLSEMWEERKCWTLHWGNSCNNPCAASLDFNGKGILRLSTEKRKSEIGEKVRNGLMKQPKIRSFTRELKRGNVVFLISSNKPLCLVAFSQLGWCILFYSQVYFKKCRGFLYWLSLGLLLERSKNKFSL